MVFKLSLTIEFWRNVCCAFSNLTKSETTNALSLFGLVLLSSASLTNTSNGSFVIGSLTTIKIDSYRSKLN